LANSANSFYDTAPFDVLIIIYGSSDQKNMYYTSLERSFRAESNGAKIVFLRAFHGKILRKYQMVQYCKMNFCWICQILTFCSISCHGTLVKWCSHLHSIQLGETFLTCYNSSFYDHWLWFFNFDKFWHVEIID
jgi:hypothetical protein